MAATLMQPPVHRPSMDRHAPSFDHPRSSSAPFASAGYDRAPSPGGASAPSRMRRSSSNSISSIGTPTGASGGVFPQYPNNYPNYHQQSPAWPAPGLPPTSFYAAPFPAYPSNAPGAFQQGFQQQHPPDFSAWAHVYQHMVASGHMPPHAQGPYHPAALPQQLQHLQHQQQFSGYSEELDVSADSQRQQTAWGSSPHPPPGGARPASSQSSSSPKTAVSAVPPQAFHPYKRSTTQQRGMPRSASQPASALSEMIKNSTSSRAVSSPVEDHRRTSSADSALRAGAAPDLAAPPRIRPPGERRDSGSSHASSRSGAASASASAPRVSTTPTRASAESTRPSSASGSSAAGSNKSAPLTSGARAANAANAPSPSPLSQSAALPSAPEAKKTPFKSRFKTSSAPDKDLPQKDKKPQPQTQAAPAPAPAPSRTESSSTSRTLPISQGTSVPLAPPSAPFVNAKAMGSDVSLAETEKTAATAATGKSRRSLFRSRNKSSDNISLASTVSSASTMLRKMGSLGKLARRNSLMGISKIFKDKPKDEDAPIPEKQGILSFKKKGGRKGELAPATISPANAELDRPSEEDDRVLDGLSPAAQLARQHTVRSRAEAAKRDAENKRRAASNSSPAELAGPTGEPTWDHNTANRNSQVQAADGVRRSFDSANIVRVEPRSPEIVRHAFAVTQPDYDSDYSSDGDTVEDVTATLSRAHISDAADAEFQAMWGKADIDRNARPKKGILKLCVSNEDLELLAIKQRPSPPAERAHPVGGPLSELPTGANIDGIPHAAHVESPMDSQYDPLSPDFAPFDNKPIELSLEPATYEPPVRNASAPALPKLNTPPRHARAMTAPNDRRRLIWAPECAVYSTYDAVTYDRRSEPATCNRLTPELAMAIKQELNAFKLEMPVHPSSRVYTHYFA